MSQQSTWWISNFLNDHIIDRSDLRTILIIALIVAALYKLLSIYGIFTNVNFEEGILQKMRIIYLSRVGRYDQNQEFYHNLKKQIGATFKISKYIGIFYDDPNKTDPANCRSIIGVSVNEGELHKVTQFLKNNSKYSTVQTKPAKCYSFTMPFINFLSLLLAQVKVYPKLNELIEKRDDIKFSPYTIQIYNEVPKLFWNKQLTIATVAQNYSDFQLFNDQGRKNQ